MRRMRQAFTLMEVNLAIFIMATGVLGMVSLYSLGFRESRQSEEDVASAGLADEFFAPLVAGLSNTNMKWDDWCRAVGDSGDNDKCNGIVPENGWEAYVKTIGGGSSFQVDSSCNSTARRVFDKICSSCKNGTDFKGSFPTQIPAKYSYGLVAIRRGTTISLSFRSSRRREALMSQPVYYTEVHFQGGTGK